MNGSNKNISDGWAKMKTFLRLNPTPVVVPEMMLLSLMVIIGGLSWLILSLLNLCK